MDATNSFTIYNASAGSGKTYTLVKEYLLLLFNSQKSDNYKNILAVTFTNKAVAEMKSRIVDNLYAFSKDGVPEKHRNLLEEISTDSGRSIEEIRLRSREILKNILHNYASFEVSTIDGFTHRVLRTFAKDLGLPLNFEVELNTSEVLQEAVERLINKAGTDNELTNVLVNFAVGKADDDKSWDIARDLFKIAELLTKETSQPFVQLLKNKNLQDFQKLSLRLKKEIKLLEQEIVKTADGFFETLGDNGLENRDFNGGYCPKFFAKLQLRNFEVNFNANWQERISEEPLYPKRVDPNKKEIMDSLQAEISLLYSEAKQKITTLEFLQAVQKNLTPLSLLSAIQDEIELIKKERSIVLISEFNATIGATVKDQPAPFIYERLGERYQHYFIDEFQDTSQLQWENLIPLIDHALTSVHPSNETASLTLVGDAKQSIYRWRGGKAEQFMDLCKAKNPFNLENKKVVVLPKNYRSAREVVDFNNDFFTFSSQCLSSIEHQDLFVETNNQVPKKASGGYVNISFIEAQNAEEEMEVYPKRVLEIIENLEEKNIPKSNICILTRTGKEGIAIANFLSENNIPIISFQSLLVSRSPEIGFIIAILSFAIDGKDKHLKLEIIEFLLEHVLEPDNEYQFISERIELEEQHFFDSLNGRYFEFNLKNVTDSSLYEAVEYIIRCFDLVKTSNAYVQFFLDFVYEAAHNGIIGIPEFLEHWEQKKETLSIVAPKSENAVQIMTIHKAKGLEFPVVIYPFADGNIQDVARESLWMNLPESLGGEIPVGYLAASRKMENWGVEASVLYQDLCSFSELDALNVLYVALTRPVQQLYVVSKFDVDKKGNGNSKKISGLLISFLKSKGMWDEGMEYEFGNVDGFISEEDFDVDSLQQESFYSSPTQGKGISIVTRSSLLWDSTQANAIEKGEVVHSILARIDTFADVEQALQHAKDDGLLKIEEEKEVRESLFRLVNHPELREYYSGASENYNERNIISGNGQVLRPDRLNISGDEVSIIDYKTGSVNLRHQEQINNYADVLHKMDLKVKKKILVYLDEELNVIFA